MINEQRLIEQFMSLVRIDSETRYEQEISIVLKREFEALGLTVFEDDTAVTTGHGSGNLFIKLLPSDASAAHAPCIFFTSHMDTVSPGCGIKPQLDDDGYIRSDGTTILGSDDKAGIAAMLEAIRVLKERKLPHGPVQFVITAGEEAGLCGARALDPAHMEAKYGYALDSNGTIGDLAVAAPTQAKVTMHVIGKSAHAGVNPEDGISAIQVAAKAISRMSLGRIDKETTANIGRFEGGGATNVVCERVRLDAEARSLCPDKLDAQLEAMRQALVSAAEDYGATARFESEIIYPGYSHGDDSPVVALAQRAIQAVGGTPRRFESGGGSDANIFNGLGIPTVNLAVGYEHIHTTKEQIKAADLVKLTALVVQIIRNAAKAASAQ
ncbi:M20/M25/M40 family metallo-hydrolase [Paenibacillus sp. IB182496]|uniref:M20/M25/M40 family metallo-hydrolase n=1 Tax=Paenibacillus sabuli TaxID=2772509 RepID=A0A927BUY8_9BACL|nr:M20/M25/M40 family metallo-hydrolase [Paenibacillus sabuli]MBD2847316.1 M20/M25/M40 family metallo-hydrolase [Paenibacillus sabuli]